MRRKYSLVFATAFALLPAGSTVAQVAESGYSLPLSLALKAVTTLSFSHGTALHP
jgi:hypothetical protein